MYYIKYNGLDLTEIINVKEVEIPSLPSMSHSSIDIFERNGSVYNGMNYGPRDINIKFIIKATNTEEYEQFVNDTKRAFYTKDEAQLFCGDEENYIWCVPTDDLIITELGVNCAEGEVSLIAYDPYWYNTIQNATNNEGSKRFTVTNNGDVETYPIINLGFTKDTTFAQITNQESGDTILLGGIPSVEGTTIKANTKILDDNMESTTGWSSSTAPIDSSRSTGGNLSVTSGGSGLMCGNFGSSSSGAKWHGACYRKSIGQSLTNFKVKVKMSHKSTGINGDPDHPYTSDPGTVTSGGITTYYKVNDSSNLNDSEYKTIARHEIKLDLEKLFKIAKKLLKNKGNIAIVHRPERLSDIVSEMKKNNIEPKRIQFVYPSINSEANILLIEGTKNGNPGVKILPPLISHKQNGEYTEQVKQFFEKR